MSQETNEHVHEQVTLTCIHCYNRKKDSEVASLKAKWTHLQDVYASLGIKWGDDPFLKIDKLREESASLRQEVESLHGIIKADDERLANAGERVGFIGFGCDTAEHMADEIEHLKSQLDLAVKALEEIMMSDCIDCISDIKAQEAIRKLKGQEKPQN